MDKVLRGSLRSPYITVKYKQDDPVTGHKKGDEVKLAYLSWHLVPPATRKMVEYLSGPTTIKEMKLAQIDTQLDALENKRKQLEDEKEGLEALPEIDEEEEEEEEDETEEEETPDEETETEETEEGNTTPPDKRKTSAKKKKR